ncbi:MAG: WGR domain-containing protein [Planctomycetaceae bacterium]|nr:WGR domain-containing protein [Planctomycetaceae bacterium]
MSKELPRMFEMKEGTSDKFWEISLDGKSHTVRYGRVGTDGQTATKDFDTEAKARASYDKLIAQKTGKGYKEVTGRSDSRQQQAKALQVQAKEREPFVKAILDEPDDPAAYLVFADWLEDQGDAQGELIRIQWQLEEDGVSAAERKKLQKREAALLEEHESAILGDLADDLISQKGPADLLWRDDSKFYRWQIARGVLDSLHIEYLLPAFVKVLRKSPAIATLRRLTIRDPSDAYSLEEIDEYAETEWDEDDAPALKMLNGAQFPNLRHFAVTEDEERNCHAATPTIHNLIKNMPRLESLQVDAHRVNVSALFRMAMPELRSLTLQHTADRYPLEVLAKNASMQRLETLVLWPHAMEYEDDVGRSYISRESFVALCRSQNLPLLRNVTLYMSNLGDEGIAALVKSPLFKQLKTLNLIYGEITDVGVQTLCDAGVSHLEVLNLSGNYISRAGTQQLQEAFPAVQCTEQFTGDPTGDDAEYLWMGDIE